MIAHQNACRATGAHATVQTSPVCSVLTDLLHELGRWESLSSEMFFELYSGALVNQARAVKAQAVVNSLVYNAYRYSAREQHTQQYLTTMHVCCLLFSLLTDVLV